MATPNLKVQLIGCDIGRGYVKGSTYVNKGKTLKEIMFKSQVGDGRDSVKFDDYTHPLYKEINGVEYFIGELSENESFNSIPNFSDDKTSMTVEILLYTLVSELAELDTVSLCLGVPNKIFDKATLTAVQLKYKGKYFNITDKLSGEKRHIKIVDIIIFRESDSALMYVVRNTPTQKKLLTQKLGMVTIGFRTTELTFFDKDLKFNDKLSKTIEVGHKTVLEIIQKELEHSKGISKSLVEIDEDKEYTQYKVGFYSGLCEKINQLIEMTWTNYKEMTIFMGGGTCLKFESIPSKFILAEDAQMITARGLYLVLSEM